MNERSMNESRQPQHPQSDEGQPSGFTIGQRVRVIRGPLRSLCGTVEAISPGGRVLIGADDHSPGLMIHLPGSLLQSDD